MGNGVSTSDFSQILSDMGRSVTYYVVTKTVNSMTGEETSTFASSSSQIVIFFLEETRYLWDKEGLLEVGDAYIIAPLTLGIKRYDKFTIDSKTYYIENITKRTVLDTAMCDWAVCYEVA